MLLTSESSEEIEEIETSESSLKFQFPYDFKILLKILPGDFDCELKLRMYKVHGPSLLV